MRRSFRRSSPQNDIPFHVVQAHRGRSVDDLRQLAINGGGLYANNNDGTLVLEDGSLLPVNNLKVLYDAIANTRLVYKLEYRTLNDSLDMFRVVVITATLGADLFASEAFGYNWEFQPAVVNFVDPDQLTARRIPSRSGGDVIFDNTEREIEVDVSFVDGVPRGVQSLRLEVIDAQTGSVQQSALEINPELNERGLYTLVWSLDQFDMPATTSSVTVTVTAVDELGISGSNTQVGEVRIDPLPATPTPVATITPIPTATLTGGEAARQAAVTILFSNTVIVDENGNPVGEVGDGNLFVDQGISVNSVVFVMIVIVALLTILLVYLISQILRQRRLARDGVLVSAPGVVEQAKDKEKPNPVGEQSNERFAPQEFNNRAEKLAEPQYDRVVSDETAKGYIEADATPEGDNYDTRTQVESVPTDPNAGVLVRMVVKAGYEDIEDLQTRVLVVRDDEYTIGRNEDNIWTVNSPIVSPRHARLKIDGERVYIRDLGSKNGTYINGERVREGRDTPVPIGSEIGITREILLQLYAPDDEIDREALALEDIDLEDAAQAGIAVFKPLPGLVYAEDTNTPPSDEYDPLQR